jgi:magnesium transporter
MNGTLAQGGVTNSATIGNVTAAVSSGKFFWLDLDDGDPADSDAIDLLLNTFHYHPLAVEDAEHFGQRPKLDDYDDFLYLVVHGASDDGSTTEELHIFFSEKCVVSVHRGACPAVEAARNRIGRHKASETAAPQIVLVYLIVDALTDSFFPILSAFDDQVDLLEDQILQQPTEEQLGQLFQMKRTLLGIRKTVTPQRDVFAGFISGVIDVPGMTDESSRYFRDLYDHLIRISDLIDSYRDLLSGVMDTHISTVSNRLNVVMKQLAIIATIFLPLSFLTGFFGQNFSFLVGHIVGKWTFIGWGLGTELAAVILLFTLFKRRGWLGGPSN